MRTCRAILEGKDTAANLKEVYKEIHEEVIVKKHDEYEVLHGGLSPRFVSKFFSGYTHTWQTTLTPVRFCFAGDMMYHSEVLGLKGNFSTADGFHCCYCEVPHKKLDSAEIFPARTVKRMMNSAHLPYYAPGLPADAPFPAFTCPHCELAFLTPEVCRFLHFRCMN